MAIVQRGSTTSAVIDTNTTGTINKPTGVVSTDVAYLFVSNNKGFETVTSTGFTQIKRQTDANTFDALIFRRVCDGSEGSTFTVNITGSVRIVMCMLAFSGVDNVTPEDLACSSQEQAGTTSLAQASQTTVTNNALVLGMWASGGNGSAMSAVIGGGATEEQDNYDAGIDRWLYVESLLKTTAGAVALTATGTGTAQTLEAIQLAIRPATGGGGPPAPTLNVVRSNLVNR